MLERPQSHFSADTHLVTVACSALPELTKPVRDFVGAILGVYGSRDLAEAGRLICSELYGNTARHVPGGPMEVALHHERDRPAFVLAVSDEKACLPAPRAWSAASPDAEDGRGLAIVAALADDFGADVLPYGKRVWCRLAVTG